MIILGIDPGIERTGYAFLSVERGQSKLVSCGCITTDKKDPAPKRLTELRRDLSALIKKYSPTKAVVESLFFAANAKTAMVVGQARGVILNACNESGLEILELTPLQVKMAATGYGRAEKTQVHCMLQKILRLKVIPKPDDVADAVAIAWAGINIHH